jgi:hypothetical protein
MSPCNLLIGSFLPDLGGFYHANKGPGQPNMAKAGNHGLLFVSAGWRILDAPF